MKKCPKCNAEVNDSVKFCIFCGFNIKKHEEESAKAVQFKFCPECGTQLSGGAFCPECGHKIDGTGIPKQEPQLLSEDNDKKKKADGLYRAHKYKEALSIWQEFAEKGDAECQYNVGDCYANGYGVPKNDQKAFYWFLKSAEQDYWPAQDLVGYYYAHGVGVSEDLNKALYWYQKAVDNGSFDEDGLKEVKRLLNK